MFRGDILCALCNRRAYEYARSCHYLISVPFIEMNIGGCSVTVIVGTVLAFGQVLQAFVPAIEQKHTWYIIRQPLRVQSPWQRLIILENHSRSIDTMPFQSLPDSPLHTPPFSLAIP